MSSLSIVHFEHRRQVQKFADQIHGLPSRGEMDPGPIKAGRGDRTGPHLGSPGAGVPMVSRSRITESVSSASAPSRFPSLALLPSLSRAASFIIFIIKAFRASPFNQGQG